LLGALLLTIAAPLSSAFADPTSEPTSDDIAEFEVIQYKVFRSRDGYAALVGGALNEQVTLPALFEVQIPAGSEILWFGEISGGPRDLDRTFDEPFTVRTEGGFDIYTALTYDHVVQIEYLIEGDPFEALGAGEHIFYLSYTPLHDARVLRLAAYLPKESLVTDPSFQHLGYAPQTDEPLYGIAFFDIVGGQTYQAELRYGPPAAIARQGSANLTEGILVTIGILVVGSVGAGIAFYLAKSRRAQAEARLDEFDEGEYDEGDNAENGHHYKEGTVGDERSSKHDHDEKRDA